MDGSPFGGLSGTIFSIVPIIIASVFSVVIGIIIVRSVQGAKQWRRNNASPVLTVDAAVVTKRADVRHYQQNTGMNDMNTMSSSTAYYATFQVASGDRMELLVSDTEYGLLAEGDTGKLTFQGTRYLGFERERI